MKSILGLLSLIAVTSCSKNGSLTENSGPCCLGISNVFKAKIKKGNESSNFSAIMPNFYHFKSTDSSFIQISGYSDDYFDDRISIDIKNIYDTGTYRFGKQLNLTKEVKIKYELYTDTYYNDSSFLTGSFKIDSFRTTIQGIKLDATFNCVCKKGTDSVIISNGRISGYL